MEDSTKTIWSTTRGGVDANLERYGAEPKSWILSLEGVGMSGYPEIVLHEEQLERLFNALAEELKVTTEEHTHIWGFFDSEKKWRCHGCDKETGPFDN